MKPKDYIKKIALGACVYYTAATFLLLFIYFALNIDLSGGMQAIALIFIFPFAVCFSSANTVYRHTALQKWLRVLIHYALTVGGTFGFLYIPNKDPQQKASTALLVFLVFTLFYAVVMGTVLLISARIHRVQRDEAKYYSVYKK